MSAGSTDAEEPPEREFDETTALQRMQEAAAESITDLPDFPGFEVRGVFARDCVHEGKTDESYINYEMDYRFSEEISKDPLVRETYLDLLRQQWDTAGYDIHRDEQRGDNPPHHFLEARRPDGINLSYRVTGLTVLRIQSGCVKVVEGVEPECPDPLPNVTSENDRGEGCNHTTTEYETEPANAVAPFEGTQAAGRPFSADGLRRE